MGHVEPHLLVMPFLAAFSRYDEALAWAHERATEAWGPVLLASPPLEFTETDYYAATMGAPLRKQLFAFERRIDPAQLVEMKLETNRWELEYSGLGRHPEPRPLNLDPGYLTSAKLVLASTKDHSHRIYLGRGIYAEVTLYYKNRRWQHREWTYPDYRRDDYHAFLDRCRARLHDLRMEDDRG